MILVIIGTIITNIVLIDVRDIILKSENVNLPHLSTYLVIRFIVSISPIAAISISLMQSLNQKKRQINLISKNLSLRDSIFNSQVIRSFIDETEGLSMIKKFTKGNEDVRLGLNK